ncbi:MAG: RiPP maturation radical SAM C-methyltransferase [Lachnospiraceae bacterium]|nr:RiPP maturation radical SAM C-methyltransferase [Lachnospiraceae bacterium]
MKNDLQQLQPVDVCLVMPPVAFGVMPSLALGILKNCLKRDGLSCYVDYANIAFMQSIGLPGFVGVYHGSMHGFLGEYIFNEAAGIHNAYSMDDFIHYQLGDKDNLFSHLNLKKILEHGIKAANEATERTVERILARNPKIVGCTAVFEQRNAALAILRRIKEKRPDIITLMGGYTCFNYGGMAMLKAFPFLDYVFCGESDDIFGPCCKGMIEGTLTELPYGLLKQGGPFPKEPPHRIVADMDMVPAPDYDDYFEQLRTMQGFYQVMMVKQRAELRLLLETSRGCWWGEKKACSFCGLNGQHMHLRRKSPEKVLQEIREVTSRYGNRHVCFTDNILPVEWFKDLLPELVKDQEETPGCFTVEIKANLREEQVKLLRDAGYRFFQPGIESLSDHVLQLLNKGVSAVQNVALLKYARQYQVMVIWNILINGIGETADDYRDMKNLMPLIEHLQPPDNIWNIIYMRDSVYHNHQEEYGLKLVPDPVFKYLSPDNPDYVENIAFHFVDENEKKDTMIVLAQIGLKQAVADWRKQWQKMGQLPRLEMYEEGQQLHIIDTRQIAPQRHLTLEGIEWDVYRAAREPGSLKHILTVLTEAGCDYAPEQVEATLNSLCERSLMISLSGKYLALAIETDKTAAETVSYREFLEYLNRDAALQKEARQAPVNDPAECLSEMGARLGYAFTPEIVRETDLIPPQTEADRYPWSYLYAEAEQH